MLIPKHNAKDGIRSDSVGILGSALATVLLLVPGVVLFVPARLIVFHRWYKKTS